VTGFTLKQTIGRTRNIAKQWRPGKTERKVQELAHRRATRQLPRVSPERFSLAQQDYLDWESFSLWVQAIVESERCVPPNIRPILEARCPGFLEYEKKCRETHSMQYSPLPLLLLEWIHDRVFAQAKEEGWLDALIFFSVRHSYSQRTWVYWEHCEDEWKRNRPPRYPTFDEWRLAAESWKGSGPDGPEMKLVRRDSRVKGAT